jgi:hypothetical protein
MGMKKSLEDAARQMFEESEKAAQEQAELAAIEEDGKIWEAQQDEAIRDTIWSLVEMLKDVLGGLHEVFLDARENSEVHFLKKKKIGWTRIDLANLKQPITLASFAFFRPRATARAVIKFVARPTTGAHFIVVTAYAGTDENARLKAYDHFEPQAHAVDKEFVEKLVEQMFRDVSRTESDLVPGR